MNEDLRSSSSAGTQGSSSFKTESSNPAAGFDQGLSLLSTLALGFTYLSPLAGVYSLFAVGMVTAGPPSVWWLLIVAVGQLLVALVFGEIVSQYPITGGLYPWVRRLWGRKPAWLVAWIYLWALVVTLAAICQFGATFVASFFGYALNRPTILATAVGLLAVAFVLNLFGTRVIGLVVKIGFWAELVGVIAVGCWLLLFSRRNSLTVVFDSLGAGGDSGYLPAFLGAAIVGLFMFYGFEACGDVAEEVQNPSRQIPRAMTLTVVVGFCAATFSFLGFLLAAPDLPAVVRGDVADPISAILDGALGSTLGRVFLLVALMAFVACTLSLQTALSRLLYAFARDEMIPGHRAIARMSESRRGEHIPRNAAIASFALPSAICLWVFLFPGSLTRVTSFGVIAIYVAFQLVVVASLRQRLRGWRPGGVWTLGRAGGPITVLALFYGVGAIIVLALPGEPGLAFVDRWVVVLGLGTVVVSGVVYMVIARPYRNSRGPEGDAIEVADALRRARGSEATS